MGKKYKAMQKSYAQDIVRSHDYNRYLVSLFAKSYTQKQALWAIYAFNYEIARTREIVSDTTIGLIRLTWWRDALKSIYGMPTEHKRSLDDHPILPELADAINDFTLPYDYFDELLLGREFDLEDLQPETLDGLITYIQNTNGPLLKLTALITGADQSVIDPLALANGLSGILRAIPFHAQHNIVMLPAAMISKDAVLTAETKQLQPCVKDIAAAAQNALSNLNTPLKGPLKALKKLTQLELNQMAKCGYDLRNKKFQQKIPFLAFRMGF